MQRENAEKLKTILNIIRKVTKAIKVFPFLYVVVLLIICPIISFSENIDMLINESCYLSPLLVLFLIYLSYAVKLCFWHRLQCTLPLIPQALVYCDTYIYEFGEALATLNFAILLILFIASLVNAYFVFVRPTRNSPL